jgi:hypothetical protein
MAFKDLARSLAVAHLEAALRDQPAAEAAGTALGRHCMGNAVGRDGQARLLVPPGLARRATSGTVSYFYSLSSFTTMYDLLMDNRSVSPVSLTTGMAVNPFNGAWGYI